MSNSNSDLGNQDLFYRDYYSKTIGNNATGLRSLLWKYPHRLFEKRFKSNLNQKILEVGAGNGEHLNFVAQDFNSYVALDIRISKGLKSYDSENIKTLEGDVCNLDRFQDSEFNRVISMCLLAHLSDPEKALREMRRVASNGSTIQIYLPCEPGLALRVFRRLVTSPAVKRMGYQGFDVFMAREHRNALYPLTVLINNVFRRDKIRTYRRPFPLLGWYFNLFYLVEVEVIKK